MNWIIERTVNNMDKKNKIIAIHLDLAQLSFYIGQRWNISKYYITDIIDISIEYPDSVEFIYQIKSNETVLQEIVNCPIRIDYDLPIKNEII